MLVYEVTATVDEALREAYERYMLEEHIDDVVQSGGFANALFTTSAPGRYRIFYFIESQEKLDAYLERHAPRTRAHFMSRFPEGIQLSREVWTQRTAAPRP
jgi:Domain of unknown function (DUF4286)